jgi:hypothetical protein
MARVRRDRVDALLLRAGEREQERSLLPVPEVAVEAFSKRLRLPLLAFAERLVVPELPRQPGGAEPFPAVVVEPVKRAAPVLEVSVAVEVGVLVEPLDRAAGGGSELPDEVAIARPALVLVEQDQPELRRVVRPVVRRVWDLAEPCQLARLASASSVASASVGSNGSA